MYLCARGIVVACERSCICVLDACERSRICMLEESMYLCAVFVF